MTRPPTPQLTPRQRQAVDAARRMLAETPWDGIGLRALADRLGMRAPSLYKHVTGKEQLRTMLLVEALLDMGEALHAAAPQGVAALLAAYRTHALAEPELYRLATVGVLPREVLPEGLEEWSGTPFWLVTRDPVRAQALWVFAHGMTVLELDGRFPPGSDLDAAWAAGAAAFGAPLPHTGR